MNAPFKPVSTDVNGGTSIARYLRDLFADHGFDREHVHAIFLGARRQFVGEHFFEGGGVAAMRLRAREIIEGALRRGATGIIISHNHPSGDCRPSTRDIQSTQRLSQIAGSLDIELLDHLIITRKRAYSMRARGLL